MLTCAYEFVSVNRGVAYVFLCEHFCSLLMLNSRVEHLQEPAIGPCPGSVKSSSHHCIIFLKNTF
jgi:hypothetical protein